MRAIVTGATGMLGWNLIEYLIRQKVEVLAVVNPISNRKDCIPNHPYVTIAECDMDSLSALPIDHPYDYFFHLGWKGTHGADRENLYLQEENVRDAMKAVDLAKRAGCEVFVGAGSQAEYGSKHRNKLSGTTPTDPETGYGIGKFAAGFLTRKRCEQLGIRHIWVRILSIYGPGDGAHTMVMSGIDQMLKGRVPCYTKAEQLWDYLYVEDAVEALYRLAQSGKDQKVYCLGSGEVRQLKEYIYDIRDAVCPELEVRIGALPYPDHQVMYLCADVEELKRDTGFTVKTSFRVGIRKTIQWVREKIAYEENKRYDTML